MTIDRTTTETVHAAPSDGASFCGCCDRTPAELSRWDRIAADDAQVTCGRLSAMDELLLADGPVTDADQVGEALIFQMASAVWSVRGGRISLLQAHRTVRSAMRELVPTATTHLSAAQMIQVTSRAEQLATR
jgi:predicted Fe-S protein YdhL (DUF1289 family)